MIDKIPTIFAIFQDDIKKRQEKKEKADRMIALSAKNEKLNKFLSATSGSGKIIRLLDEGKNIDQNFLIPKGELQRFYDDLPDDYVGYINIAHISLVELPMPLGYWTKEDLEIVPLKEDSTRMGLNCTPHFDYENPFVQYLSKTNIPLAVSVEMRCELNLELTEALGCSVFQNLFVQGFSVVGCPSNTNSVGLELGKGEYMSFLNKLLSKYTDEVEETEVEDIQEEETIEEPIEDKKESTEDKSEDKVEPIEDESDDDKDLEEDLQKLDSLLNEKDEEIKRLKAELEQSKTNEIDLNAQLKEIAEQNKKLNATMDDSFEKLNALLQKNAIKKEKDKKDPLFG